MEEQKNYLSDAESGIEFDNPSEKTAKIFRNMGSYYISREQVANKGKKLAHYKSWLFFRTYIDLYENAMIGLVECSGSRKLINIEYGYFYLEKAVVEDGMLFLIMCDEKIYRIRHLKDAELIAYAINKQKSESKK